MTPSELEQFLTFTISHKMPVLITGIPGIGKTDITHAACKSSNANLILSHPVVSDPTDYKGLPFAGSDGIAHFMPFGDLHKLIEAKEPTVFFLDDFGQAPISVQAACMQLILARQINGHKVSEHVTFIAATNRKEDKAGVTGILEPVKSRFVTIVQLEVNVDDWVKWALRNNMPTELIGFVRFRPTMLSDFKPTKSLTNSTSPRTLANVGRLQKDGLNKNFEMEVFTGAAGEAFAVEYLAFLQMYRELPSVDEIILNPDKAKVTKDPGCLCAVSSALAHRMNETNQDSIITYLDRLPTEIAVVTMKDAVAKDRSLSTTKSFIKWGASKGDLIL